MRERGGKLHVNGFSLMLIARETRGETSKDPKVFPRKAKNLISESNRESTGAPRDDFSQQEQVNLDRSSDISGLLVLLRHSPSKFLPLRIEMSSATMSAERSEKMPSRGLVSLIIDD